MYLQFTINLKKKPNAPHQDFLFLRIIFREVFFVIIVNMKVKYTLT